LVPDGTRIITGYMTETEPVTCEWTRQELQRYFGIEFPEMDHRDSNDELSHPEDSLHSDCTSFEELEKLSLADGFVSILLIFRMEHEDYATVFYDQSAARYTLSMPDNLRVSVSERGHYEVSIGDEVNLKVINVAPRERVLDNSSIIGPQYQR